MKRSTVSLVVLVCLFTLELLMIATTGSSFLKMLITLLTLCGIYYMLGITVTEPNSPKGNGEYKG